MLPLVSEYMFISYALSRAVLRLHVSCCDAYRSGLSTNE